MGVFLDVICYTSVKDAASWAVGVEDAQQHPAQPLKVMSALGGPGTTPRRRESEFEGFPFVPGTIFGPPHVDERHTSNGAQDVRLVRQKRG